MKIIPRDFPTVPLFRVLLVAFLLNNFYLNNAFGQAAKQRTFHIVYRVVKPIWRTKPSPHNLSAYSALLGGNQRLPFAGSDAIFLPLIRKEYPNFGFDKVYSHHEFTLETDQKWIQPSDWTAHNLWFAILAHDTSLLLYDEPLSASNTNLDGKQSTTGKQITKAVSRPLYRATVSQKQLHQLQAQGQVLFVFTLDQYYARDGRKIPFVGSQMCVVTGKSSTLCLTTDLPVTQSKKGVPELQPSEAVFVSIEEIHPVPNSKKATQRRIR